MPRYAPDNEAMTLAFKHGLPTWEQVQEVMDKASANDEAAKAKALKMAEAIRNFIRYHFQDFALYADNTIDYGDAQEVGDGNRSYMTSCTIGSAYKRLKVKGGSGKLYVTDEGNNTVFINANGDKLVNFMARDYIFKEREDIKVRAIETSSFTAIHEISKPLCFSRSKRYDDGFASNTPEANQARLKNLKNLYYAQKHGIKFYK